MYTLTAVIGGSGADELDPISSEHITQEEIMYKRTI